MYGPVPPVAAAVQVTCDPAASGEERFGDMPVSESAGGAEIETGPAGRHASNVVLDPAFRAQTWKLYVPGVVGCQTHVLLALQSWPST